MKMTSRSMQHLGLAVLVGLLLASASMEAERHGKKAGTIECPAKLFACTGGVAVNNATFDGRPVLWQVMDLSWERSYSQLWKYRDSTVEVLYYAVSPNGYVHSLNSHGLGRGINNQSTLDYDGDGVVNPLKLIIDRECTSIADVREVLDTKNYDMGRSFPYVDAEGEGTYFEVADNDYWEYCPTDSSRKANPDYDYSDPYSFVVRGNMPFKNRNHQEFDSVMDSWAGEYRPRQIIAREQMSSRIDDTERLTPREVLEIVRFGDPGFNDADGVICEEKSRAATIYLGIRKGENPAFTTALYAMGIPDYTICIPAWCKLSDGDLSPYVKGTSPTIYSWSQQLFGKNKNDGNGIHPSDDDFIQGVFGIVEDNVLEGVLSTRNRWLNLKQDANYYEEMKRLHKYSCDAAYWTVRSAYHTADFGARTINRPPALTSLGASIDGCTVKFNGNAADSDGLQHVVWDFGDGSTYTGSLKASHTYSRPGTYVVLCYVEDGNSYKAANVRFEVVTVTGGVAKGGVLTK